MQLPKTSYQDSSWEKNFKKQKNPRILETKFYERTSSERTRNKVLWKNHLWKVEQLSWPLGADLQQGLRSHLILRQIRKNKEKTDYFFFCLKKTPVFQLHPSLDILPMNMKKQRTSEHYEAMDCFAQEHQSPEQNPSGAGAPRLPEAAATPQGQHRAFLAQKRQLCLLWHHPRAADLPRAMARQQMGWGSWKLTKTKV